METRSILGYGRNHPNDPEQPVYGEYLPEGGFHIDEFFRFMRFTDQLIQWVEQHRSQYVPEGETVQ